VDDPNYLKRQVASDCRELCSRLVGEDADVYGTGIELQSLLGLNLPNDVPGRLYAIWGELIDRWELDPDRHAEAEGLMRDAAADFLAIGDDTAQLDAYLSRWWGALALAS
jgi:hypothetical protein